MANGGDALEDISIGFLSGAMPDDTVAAHGILGRESISSLFAFDVLLLRPAPYSDGELDEMLSAPCAIAMGKQDGDVVHGMLESIRTIDVRRTETPRYIARVVPSVWLLSLPRASRVYQNVSVPDLARQVLGAYGMVEGEQFEVHAHRGAKSPVHEYIVQYEESDWDFLQRWLEREGFFYWFKHTTASDVLVMSDENADATLISGKTQVSYREQNNLSTGGEQTIWDFCGERRRIPARVGVHDYNYRTPSIPLVARADVDTTHGFGTVFTYAEHFKDVDEGAALAQVRAERLFMQRRTYRARTDCSRFRAGYTFELENHPDASLDGGYLITSIEHRVGLPIFPDRDDLGELPERYLARFSAIPRDIAYRPERRTPWPRIHGVMHAHIDGDTTGDYAELDNQGRYRVRMPFDLAASKGQKASRYIRMAQPHSGPGYGSHHPLHKGVEVLLSHVNGDPDRPVIVGSVPNPQTPSPVVASNATQSVVQTASGIRVEMEDLQT